jgi:hypothetical protein
MAVKIWQGDAIAIAQVSTVVVTAVDGTPANNTFTLTATDEAGNTVAVSVVGDTDTATTAAALNTAWNASASPVVQRVNGTVSSSTITLTATQAGVPFTIASSVTGGGSGTIGAVTAVTANSGPNTYGLAENWFGGVAPTGTDDVVIPPGSPSILYGLDQSGTSLVDFRVEDGYGGTLGGTDGGYLKITASTDVDLEGHGRYWIDFAASSTPTITIRNSGRASPGVFPVKLKGTDIDTVHIQNGVVGFGVEGDDTTSQCTNFLIGTNNGNLTIGRNVASNAGGAYVVNMWGGVLRDMSSNAISTLTMVNGQATIDAGAVTTVNLYGGRMVSNTTSTITTLNIYGGVADFVQSRVARTVTTVNLDPRRGGTAAMNYDPAIVTLTNAIASTDPLSASAGSGSV